MPLYSKNPRGGYFLTPGWTVTLSSSSSQPHIFWRLLLFQILFAATAPTHGGYLFFYTLRIQRLSQKNMHAIFLSHGRSLNMALSMALLVTFPLFSLTSGADTEIEIEMMRRFEIEQIQREAEALGEDNSGRRQLQSSIACPVGTTLAWSNNNRRLYARFGSIFSKNQYEPTNCHQHELDAAKCPPSGPKTWMQYEPLLLEITATASKGTATNTASKGVANKPSWAWTTHFGKSCQVYADGDSTGRTLEESKRLCLARTSCKAVVCLAGKPTGHTE